MTRSLKVLCVLAPLVGLGCTGMLDDRSNRRPRGGTTQPGDTSVGGPPVSTPGIPNSSGPAAQPGAGALSDGNSVPGPAPLRRLTRLEYENTLRDLLGVTGAVTSALQVGTDAESGQAGFVKGGAITGGDDARNLMTAATQITDAIKGRLGSLLPCNPLPTAAGEQEACAKKFISEFGKRAYRRPVSDREADLALGLYTTQRGPDVGASFEDAMVAVIAGFIQAPQFLYHWELGPNAPLKDGKDGNLVKYNSYEMASRLSYLLWATMPDDKLFAAADARALQTPEQIAGEASRLLADERAAQGLANFQLQWLEIGDLTQVAKDEQQKNWSQAVAKSMLTEVRDFAASVYRGGKTGSTLEALLTSQTTFADAGLGKIYGLNMTGTDVKEVALNPAQRAGVLTQLAFLSAHADTGDSHPVKRSDAIVRRLLCVDLEQPANIEVPPVAEPTDTQTTRERFDVHGQAACAKACHQLLDPIGFAFESFDAIGTYRTTDRNKPVDTTGSLTLPSGTPLSFKDAPEMVGKLAKLPEVQDCMATQWMRYMLGRREVEGEAPSLAVLRDVFKKSNHDLRELLIGMTRTRSFTHRSLSAGEVAQ
jgi:hypothetical protein